MENIIIAIEDDKKDFDRLKESLDRLCRNVVSYKCVENLIEELEEQTDEKFISIFQEWIEQIRIDYNVIAIIIDINLFDSSDEVGLKLQKSIRDKDIFKIAEIEDKFFAEHVPIYILTNNTTKEMKDIVYENKPTRYFTKQGSNIEDYLIRDLKEDIENYISHKDSMKIQDKLSNIENKVDNIIDILNNMNKNEQTDFEKTLNDLIEQNHALTNLTLDEFVDSLPENSSLIEKLQGQDLNIVNLIQEYCLKNTETFENALSIIDLLK